MIGLTSLEVYNSVFNITREKNKFELYKFLDEKSGVVSYEKVRDDIEKDLEITVITATDIQDDIIGHITFGEYREEVPKSMEDGGYMNISAGQHSSIFQDFESYLGTKIHLVEDDNRLDLDNYITSFTTYELQPGIYTFKDLSGLIFNILQPENSTTNAELVFEFDDNKRKTKLVLRSGIIAIRFDGN